MIRLCQHSPFLPSWGLCLPIVFAFILGMWPFAIFSLEPGLTAVKGLQVGHYTMSTQATGCTAVLVADPEGVIAGVDVRGGAPSTQKTELLHPTKLVQRVNGLLLSGGSTFGLESAMGVVHYLRDQGVGYRTPAAQIPIVPAAVIYDLGVGDSQSWPTAQQGYLAAQKATDGPVKEGSVGAGTGATVGKFADMSRSMKGGLGSFSLTTPNGLVVSALVVVNAVGDIVEEQGQIIAGVRTADGKAFADARQLLRNWGGRQEVEVNEMSAFNTTLGVVATNANLDAAQATVVAQMAHDGFARAIVPSHMPSDGDVVFALATGDFEPSVHSAAFVGAVGALAAEVMAEAIRRAVR